MAARLLRLPIAISLEEFDEFVTGKITR